MRKLKLALNASTLVKGGALQVCVNLVREAVSDPLVAWSFIVTPSVQKELAIAGVSLSDADIDVVDDSPSRSSAARRQVLNIVERGSVDGILTVFGPAYVRFSVPHVMGVADPWVTHASWSTLLGLRNAKEILRKPLIAGYKGFWYRSADAWIVEAEVAKRGLISRWGLQESNIRIIPNNCGPAYREYPFRSVDPEKWVRQEKIQVATLSAYYAHKNLELIPKVAEWLNTHGFKDRFVFNLTLPERGEGWTKIRGAAEKLGVLSSLKNWGSVAVANGPHFYDSADVMFLPTLLETFSANYPEAMAAGRAIVTSDLSFAHSVCGDAAEYFDPLDAEKAAKALLRVVQDAQRQSALIKRGYAILEQLPQADEKYQAYREFISQVVSMRRAAKH